MPQNYLNLADTYGRGVADRERSEFNALRKDALTQQTDIQQRTFDEQQQRANTEWLAGATRYALENPQSLSGLIQEGQRRGIVAPGLDVSTITPEALTELHQNAMAALGGPPQQAGTSGIKEYQFARSQGFQGSFADWKKQTRGGVSVDARQMGTVPPGYQARYDEEGRVVSMTPIPGGPAEREIEAAQEQEAATRETQRQSGDLLLDEINRSFERIGPKAGGFLPATGAGGAMVRTLPGALGAETKAQQLEAVITTLKSNIGFDRLQEMRNNSPTGGALGQVSEMENKLLQATAGNLDPNQPDWMFAYNLGRLYNKYKDVVDGKGNGTRWNAPEAAYRRLYENADDPLYIESFKNTYGYIPPGFE